MTPRNEEIARMVAEIGQALIGVFKEAAGDEGPPLGFCLWIFDEVDPFAAFVSNAITNAQRPALIRVLRAHLASLERDERAERGEPH